MIKKLLTLAVLPALITTLMPSNAHAQTPLTCPERDVKSVSVGAMVNKTYTIAAFCFTGGVSSNKTLTVAGETVDMSATDSVCAAAKVSFVSKKTQTITVPLNCDGRRLPLQPASVSATTAATISLCMVEKSSNKTLACSSNAVYPSAPALPASKIVRR
jgi:hypothetical protein